mgnify:CR=1 FL=1
MARALDHFASLGVKIARVMTDNGSAYRSHLFADLLTTHPAALHPAPL